MRDKRFNLNRKLTSQLEVQFGGRVKNMNHKSQFYFGISRDSHFPLSMSVSFPDWAFWFRFKRPSVYGKERFE